MRTISIFFSFQKDLGAPLSHKNVIYGLLIDLPENLTKTSIFVDVYQSYYEINCLMNDSVIKHRHNLPRKRARYDNFDSRHRRRRYSEKKELLNEQKLSPHNKLVDISEHVEKEKFEGNHN